MLTLLRSNHLSRVLRSKLSRVRPERTQKCCISFETTVCVFDDFQRSEDGLFINMNSFFAFGKDFVVWNYEKTGNPVYLHINRSKKLQVVPEDRHLKNPKEIGVDGGGFDNHKPEYEETYSIIILPDFVFLPFPSVELPEMIRLAVDIILRAEGGLILQRLGRLNTIVNHKYYLLLPETEMTTVERELDQNTNFDWNWIQESGQEAEPLYVLGYTGLIKHGNRYYKNQSLKDAFDDPTLDLNMQLTKLGHGLLFGKYSFPAPEDALEFFIHLLDKVERANTGNAQLDSSTSFNFGIEERLLCPTGKVSYNKKIGTILFLNIPLHEATNKELLEAFHKLKLEKSLEGKDISSDEIVRPREPLEACLANFLAPEDVHKFYSCALNAKTTSIKPIGLTSFPGYLVLHMRKFIMEEGWVPKKLDVYIDVPDVIDISHSKGLQPGEELLPEGGVDGGFDNHRPEYEGAGAAAAERVRAGSSLHGFWPPVHWEGWDRDFDPNMDDGIRIPSSRSDI